MWRVAVCTWNVQGLAPPSVAALRPVLLLHSFSPPDVPTPEPITPQVPAESVAGLQCAGIVVPDLYAICLQEADLSTEALVHSTGLSLPLTAWEATFSDALSGLFYGAHYTLARAKQLGGLGLFLYVRSALLPRVSGVLDGSLPFGWGGVLANKGAVAIRLLLSGVPCVFIGAHLTPHAPNAARRNAEVAAVTARLQLGGSGGGGGGGVPLAGHALSVWCGDLNYRLDLAEADGTPLVRARQWAKLAAHDQLRAGGAFAAYTEEALTFCPSYKFTRDGRFATDRLPAFTDRVLFAASAPLVCRSLAYTSVPLLLGDHLPVHALLELHAPPAALAPPAATPGSTADPATLFELARVPGPPSPPPFGPPPEAAPLATEAEAALGERPLSDLVWLVPLTPDAFAPLPAPLPPWPLMAVPPLVWQTLDAALDPPNARHALHPRGALADLARLLGPGAVFPRLALAHLPDERVLRLLHPLQLATLLFLLAAARHLVAAHGHSAVALAYVLSRLALPEPRGGTQLGEMQRLAQFMLNLIYASPSTPSPSLPPPSPSPSAPSSASPAAPLPPSSLPPLVNTSNLTNATAPPPSLLSVPPAAPASSSSASAIPPAAVAPPAKP